MLPFQVPAQTQPPPAASVPLEVALARVLDEYDLKGEGVPLAVPPVGPADAPSLRWLLEALTRDLPDNPFPKGGAAHREAESVRALLQAGEQGLEGRVAGLELRETGSQLALWRWGRRLARAGHLGRPLRLVWEDVLLAVPAPTLATSYALRHALSFALAEADLGRFSDLKADHGIDAPQVLLDFQRLFGLLGTQGPRLHLWSLPDLKVTQGYLKDLGADRIWISPGEPSRPPAGAAWIIPSHSGGQEAAAPSLDEASRMEAETLAKALAAAGGKAWFAPNPGDFEDYGLILFPVLIQTDFRGMITSIRIGEAAPERP